MWIKNATVIGLAAKSKFDWTKLAGLLFLPITDLQAESSGWAELRDGQFHLRQGQHTLLYFMAEKKHIPKSAIDTMLEARCSEFEEEKMFAPGKKARKELRECVIDELLPRALATRRRTAVWIDLDAGRIVIDSTSAPVIEAVQRALIKTFEGIGLQDVSWPRAAMLTHWLEEPPSGFTNDDEVSLQYPGEKGKTVKYKSADLFSEDVQQNLKLGATVDALAMTFDDRLSFVMTDNLRIKRIKPLDIIKESAKEAKNADRFENDFYLMTAELGRLLDTLIAEA